MNRRFLFLIVCLISFLLFTSLFPSICFSESKTVMGENCQIYLGDMKNKKELEKFRKSVREKSILDGISKLRKEEDKKMFIPDECLRHVISNYLDKVVVVSHTEKGRKICDKVKITSDPEVINKYLSQEICIYKGVLVSFWSSDINQVLKKKSDKIINMGLIIETKIPDLDGYKRELLENEEEEEFHVMVEMNKEKYKVIDRKHLSKILEEQKLSSSGITDTETVKLGKILNLDIIVLRVLYDRSQVTKVLKVDTGEVLLFKTYQQEKEEGWTYYGESQDGFEYYYDKKSMTTVTTNVFKVWIDRILTQDRKDKIIQSVKEHKKKEVKETLIDYTRILQEVDCKNNTTKSIKFVFYNEVGKILDVINVPNPMIEEVLPETMDDLLLRKVCQK